MTQSLRLRPRSRLDADRFNLRPTGFRFFGSRPGADPRLVPTGARHTPSGGDVSLPLGPRPRADYRPRLDRPETANWLAGRSPPSKADRARGVPPHEVAGYAQSDGPRTHPLRRRLPHKVLATAGRRPPRRDTKPARGPTPYRRPQTTRAPPRERAGVSHHASARARRGGGMGGVPRGRGW